MHPTIRRLLAILLGIGMAAGLAACQTTAASTSTGASAPITTIDQKIANTSKQLAQYCTVVSLGMTTAEAFVTNPKVDEAIGYGKVAVDQFCSAPPSNTAEAINQLAAVAIKIANAVAQAKHPTAAAAPAAAPAG